jgi:hypothetical protein
LLIKEPLVAVLPTGHRLAALKEIRPQDIANQIYIAPTRVAPVLKAVLDNYAAKSGISLRLQIRRRKSIVGDVIGGIHGRRDLAAAVRAKPAFAVGRRSASGG